MLFINVSLIEVEPVPLLVYPETPATLSTVQVYVEVLGIIVDPEFVKDTVNGVPLHAVVWLSGKTGVGFTVTTSANGEPIHVPDVGVTV